MRCGDMMTRMIACCALLLCCARPMSAADSGIDGLNLQTYAPAIDQHGMLNLNGPRLLQSGEFSLKLDTNAAGGGPFIVTLGGTPIRLLDRVVTANVLAAVGINNGITVAVDLPYHAFIQGVDANTSLQYRNHALGDIRLALKFRVLEEQGKRPGLALLVSNTLPTGNTALMIGSTGMVPGVELIAGKTLRYFRLAATLGAQFPRAKTVLGSSFDDRVTYGVGADMPIEFLNPGWSIVSTVRGSIDTELSGQNGKPVEWLMGVRKQFRNGVDVTAAGGGGFDRAIGNPQWRAVVSVGYSGAVHRADTADAAAVPVPRSCPRTESCAERPRVPNTACAKTLAPVTINYPRHGMIPDREQRTWLQNFAQQWQATEAPPSLQIATHSHRAGHLGRQAAAWRARQVQQLLHDAGVPAAQSTIQNFGHTQPVDSGDTAAAQYQNRRVTVAPAVQ